MHANRISALVVGCTLVFSVSTFAGDSPTSVARGVYLFAGALPESRQPDGNSVVLVAPRGLIVVDTGRHPAHTTKLIDFASAQHRPIAAIVNTHWHLDHTGGNVLLRQRYPHAQVYASGAIQKALQGFLRDYRGQLADAVAQSKVEDDSVRSWQAEIKLIDAGTALTPDIVIDASKSIAIAGRRLKFHLERDAVTAGDLWIEDSAQRVVISGDLVTLPIPFFDTACPRQWELALQHVAATPFETLIPGHGRPLSAAEFETYRRAFSELLVCADSKDPDATCIDRWTLSVTPLVESDERARISPMLGYYLKSALRAPRSTRDRYCPA